VVGLAAVTQDFEIGDLHHLLLPAGQCVGAARQLPPEGCQLHALLLKCAVGEKQFHNHLTMAGLDPAIQSKRIVDCSLLSWMGGSSPPMVNYFAVENRNSVD
jgi:hypothetical protein